MEEYQKLEKSVKDLLVFVKKIGDSRRTGKWFDSQYAQVDLFIEQRGILKEKLIRTFGEDSFFTEFSDIDDRIQESLRDVDELL